MEHMTQFKNTVLVVAAAVLGAVADGLGGWDAALQVLIGCMVVDYVSGLVVAGVFKRSPKTANGALESRAGFKGLLRKGGILLVVLVAVWLDRLMEISYVRTTVCFFFIANEGLSIVENLGLMGVPMPAFLLDMLEAMRKRSDAGEGTDDADHS